MKQFIVDVAIEADIINKSGSWYSYNGTKIAQGKENVKAILNDNEEMLQEIETKVREKMSASNGLTEVDLSE